MWRIPLNLMPLYLIVLLPLLGFLINGLFGAKLKKPLPGIIACVAVGAAFVVAVMNVLSLASATGETRRITETAYTWMSVGSFKVDVSFLLDPLSAVMILVVTGIGFLIHLYSTGYMHDDHNDPESKLYARYFACLNLFIAFMSILVLADNYLLMFVGWEGVGLCSYFLVGFWFNREDAAQASKKAFVINRIGDMGFLLGMMLLFIATGTLKYFGDANASGAAAGALSSASTNAVLTAPALGGALAISTVTLITLLFFVGACGKSAQIPLYTWLPDAMAGPTPVSALIHAATMVTAGVYMCARSSALFELAPDTKLIICIIGALTAFFAAMTALAHNDIKKVLAYSTVSQLGFMFMGIGSGAYVAAIFHVFTHAFFKACLFLGAGSVIHALHGEQDMRKMGGLASKMRATNLTFLLSGLALAGAAPFAGFFSKDEIIAEVWKVEAYAPIYQIIGVVALVTAFITAIYTGRQYAQVFKGAPRDAHLHEHAHESPVVMTIPLYVLAAGAVAAGFFGVPHISGLPEQMHAFSSWLSPVLVERAGEAHASAATDVHGAENPVNWILLGLGVLIGWGGWLVGRGMGIKSGERALLSESSNRLSLDAVYESTIVRVGFALSAAMRWIDEKIVDGLVNGVGVAVGEISQALRLTQTSYVRNYALGMALGAAVIIGLFVARGS